VNRRQRALAAGLAVTALYLTAAVMAGRVSVLARRPLLDGFAPPPPYRWVSPPPALASSNKTPLGGRFTLDLDPQTGTQANVFSTGDSQASLALGQGAFGPLSGDSSVLLTITPLVPTRFGPPPPGWTVIGNVYQVTASYRPSGTPIQRMREPGQMVMEYPHTGPLVYRHAILESSDGKTWNTVTGFDSPAQQLYQANVSALGYFAVGRSGLGAPVRRSLFSRLGGIIIPVAGVIVLAIIFGISERRYRRRRRARQGARTARPRPAKRAPPKRSRRIDPWE
jgi:hypothetical protein